MSYVRRVAAAGALTALALTGCTSSGNPRPAPSVTPTPSPTASGSTLVAVPDVRRLALTAAERDLAGAGLSYEVLTVADTSVADGQVLDTVPAAGRRVRPGTTVTVREAIRIVVVPAVVGRTIADAVAEVRARDLQPDEVGPRFASAPAGARVVDQRPPAGERVRAGSHVTLAYSLPTPSPTPTRTPSARPTTAPPTSAPPSTAPPPTSAPPTSAPPPSTAPPPTSAPPTSAPPPSTAPPPTTGPPTPSPSTDPGDTTVPAVVGEDEADARSALAAAGLSAKVVTVERPDAPDGTVLRVLPAAGSTVGRGNVVTLYVAVTTVAVPDVVGQPAGTADERLAAVGLTPGHEPADAGPDAVVVAQEPAAGQRLRHGGDVLLQLDAGPTAPPTDTPPTDVPPTDAPPTDAPPTDAPPTDTPPTDSPATDDPGGG